MTKQPRQTTDANATEAERAHRQCTLADQPEDAASHRVMAEARRRQGDELAALAHLIAAHTLDSFAADPLHASVRELCDVATGYYMKGDHATAESWYRLVLKVAPGLPLAHQNLSAICAGAGRRAEAEAHRAQAYRAQRVFIEQAARQARPILILCAGREAGNIPFEILLPTDTYTRIKYVIDYAGDEEDHQLPPFDLVFNAIGDADVAASMDARLTRFGQRCQRPMLNAPAAVARTQRHRLAALLSDIDDVVIAPCIRVERGGNGAKALASTLASENVQFPILARPTATHGGEGLARCQTLAALEQHLAGTDAPHYLSAFLDYRSVDSYYRKYRMIFIDRRPWPYHLAISSYWMVHYFSADMAAHPWKIDEERHFLANPADVLGARAMTALAAIGRRLDLDYAGIDFTLLPDGRIFLFEANATMRVHYERADGPLAHKNRHVQAIIDAFARLLSRHALA